MIRLFVAPELVFGETATLTGEQAHYVSRVMRQGVGDVVFLLDGMGEGREGRIEAVAKDAVTLSLGPRVAVAEPPVAVTLYQALPKADKLEWILQKATELGVSRVVPLAAARSVVQVEAGKREAKLGRWRKIVLEAAEQCERGRVPEVSAPMGVADVVLAPGEWGLVLAERAGGLSLPAALPPIAPAGVSLFVGPEGGWTDVELETLVGAGARAVTLGPRILRTETAALAAVALVSAKYEL